MDATQYVIDYYGQYDEDNRLRSQSGSVEFLTTMRYIEKYLKPGDRVIEIGAGTGRYSHVLAQKGYHVDAVELVEHNIDIFKQNTTPDEPVTVTQGNALDLSAFPDDAYDVALLLGPMYHLFTEADQRQALSEALRVTKPGGFLFAAYCGNDATMVQYLFGRGLILDERYQKLVDPVTFKANASPDELFVLYRREEIDALTAHFPVKRLHYVGTDMATHYMRETVDAMNSELFDCYLRYHFSICERPDLVGASHHFLDVLQKDAVTLRPMTRALCHELYRDWENDPAIYADMAQFKPYAYDKTAVDRYFDTKQEPSRLMLAVMLGQRPIGEVQLKHIDRERGDCTLSIHLQNDAVKGRGYATQAERLALRYAFEELGLNAVNADTILTNTRSQHILEKIGFRFVREENGFRCYRRERSDVL